MAMAATITITKSTVTAISVGLGPPVEARSPTCLGSTGWYGFSLRGPVGIDTRWRDSACSESSSLGGLDSRGLASAVPESGLLGAAAGGVGGVAAAFDSAAGAGVDGRCGAMGSGAFAGGAANE